MPHDDTNFTLSEFPLRDRVEVDHVTECWEWTRAKTRAGYGETFVNGKVVYTHRISVEFFIGPIADKMHVDHLCRNPSCCNPKHLEVVTHAENLRRSPTVKLNQDSANEIRVLHAQGITPKELASRYSISRESVYGLLKGRTWRDQ